MIGLALSTTFQGRWSTISAIRVGRTTMGDAARQWDSGARKGRIAGSGDAMRRLGVKKELVSCHDASDNASTTPVGLRKPPAGKDSGLELANSQGATEGAFWSAEVQIARSAEADTCGELSKRAASDGYWVCGSTAAGSASFKGTAGRSGALHTEGRGSPRPI